MKSYLEKAIENEVNRKKANNTIGKEIEVIREGLFGAYEFKVGKYHFEMKQINPGSRYSVNYWQMVVGEKPAVKILYKYVVALTYKILGII